MWVEDPFLYLSGLEGPYGLISSQAFVLVGLNQCKLA